MLAAFVWADGAGERRQHKPLILFRFPKNKFEPNPHPRV
jgi:hypothetical protein